MFDLVDVSYQMTMLDNKILITISARTEQPPAVDAQALHEEAAGYIAHYVATRGNAGANVHDPAHSPVEEPKTPPTAGTPPAEMKSAPKPWENATEQPRGLNFQPDATLHAKMNWVCDNVPKMSRLRILREGATLLCDYLVDKHYKE
ncbi:hypothetical protein HH212_10995 [Massilia forsythiae]|uniref:Uncharacterized protein n=1 Tax=Massilia forsythiae TaxID=2728020 RepID=A0A7Z2VWL4_9BURK|nr:hypothetical protein [Massilia forsythiae]QJE00480.1 hypothetical protein HH212_10995 [Massilia forsythiae]